MEVSGQLVGKAPVSLVDVLGVGLREASGVVQEQE